MKQAFGTGTHQTTRLVISSLLDTEIMGKRVLDCGCGSGILSIAASKLGAKDVLAYDIDEWSVRNTQHNAALNGIENIKVVSGDVSVLVNMDETFDIIMANINRNILLKDMPAFARVMNRDGILILSGFYQADSVPLLKRASEFNLIERGRRIEDNWTCLTLHQARI